MQTPVALLSLVACFSLAGCCARCPQASPATLSPAVSGCVLGPPDAHVQLGEGGTVASALTSERYQRPGCAARFVVEVAAALGRSFAVVAGWGEPLPDEERTCGEAVADVEVYGHALRFERGSGGSRSGGSYRFVWKRLGSALLVGAYLMGRCRLVAVRGELPVIQSSIYASVRVAVRAAALPLHTRFVNALGGAALLNRKRRVSDDDDADDSRSSGAPQCASSRSSTSWSGRSACRRTSGTRSACGSPRAALAADLR